MSDIMNVWNDSFPPLNLYNYPPKFMKGNMNEAPYLTVFSKNNCPACLKTETLLNFHQIPHKTVKIDEDDKAKQFILGRGFRTVPQIFKGNDIFVRGGYLELVSMSKEEIEKLLYGENRT